MSSNETTRTPEISPSTQLALLRHLLQVAVGSARAAATPASILVEGDLLRDPLPAYTNVAVDFDLLTCRLPRPRV